ncbi:MAG: hypothetical protein JNM83_10035 [Myxococcales bacterium]|nr:hypothetical protein [Myxococcales bacterium]
MPTSSSAQPMMAFSSPLLSSVERLLSGFTSRFSDGGMSPWLSRSQSFTDRILGRRLSSLGLSLTSANLGFAPREQYAPSLTPAESWIPTAAELRGPSPSRAATGGTLPTATASATATKARAASPVGSPALALPMVAPAASLATPAVTAAATATAPRSSQAETVVRSPSPAERALAALPALSDTPSTASSSAVEEPRGRELLAEALPFVAAQPAAPFAPDRGSALGRSFMHLGWSDARLGLQSRDPLLAMMSSGVSSLPSLPFAGSDAAEPIQPARVAQGAALAQLLVAPESVAPARGVPALRQPARSPSSMPMPAAAPEQLRGTETSSSPPVTPAIASPAPRRPLGGEPAATTLRPDEGSSVVPPATAPTVARIAGPDLSLVDPVSLTREPAVFAADQAAPVGEATPSAQAETASLAAPSAKVVPSAQAETASVAARSVQAPQIVPERRVESRRQSVQAEMAGLLTPLSPELAPSLWLGDSVGQEQAGPLSQRQVTGLPSLPAAKSWTSPGRIGSQVEQLAARIALPSAVSLPSVEHPRAAAQWSQAPGLPASVLRLLQAQAQSDTRESGPRAGVPAMSFLPAPQLTPRTDDHRSVPSRPARLPSEVAATAQTLPARVPAGPMEVPSALSPVAAPTLDVPAGTPALGPAEAPVAMERLSSNPLLPLAKLSSTAAESRTLPPVATGATSAVMSNVSRSPERALSSAQTAATPAMARPWQQAGGVATLAELFAAGVGLSSGVAQRVADSFGLGLGTSALPSWLSRSPALPASAIVEDASSRMAPALPYLSTESAAAPAAARATGRILPLSTAAMNQSAPTGSGLSPDAASLPLSLRATEQPSLVSAAPHSTVLEVAAVDEAVVAVPSLPGRADGQPSFPSQRSVVARERILGQVGGLAASSEAFARDHGIARAEELFPSVQHSGEGTPRRMPVAGGQMLLATDGPVGLDRSVKTRSPVAARRLGNTTAPSVIQEDQTEATRQALPSLTGWQNPGGMALRSEILATQLGLALPGISSTESRKWSRAPGLTASLTQLLSSPSHDEVQPRWAFGPQGLLFVSGPEVSSEQPRQGSRAQATGPASAPLLRQSSQKLMPPTNTLGLTEGPAHAQTVDTSPVSVLATEQLSPREQAGTSPAPLRLQESTASPVAALMPWLRLGGMGALAELFAAGVGLGSGAAGSLAHSLGLSSGRSLTPDWLRQMTHQPSSQELTSRLADLLPTLELPPDLRSAVSESLMSTPARSKGKLAESMGMGLAPAASASAPSHAPPRVLGSLLAGGLAATAEDFARRHGMERVASDEGFASQHPQLSDESTAGRWLPVAGGMVFVPREPAAPSEQRVQATRAAAPAAALGSLSTMASAPASGGTTPALPATWSQLGGLGLRSELFSALLGPQSSQLGATMFPALTGWEDIASLLTSLPKSTPDSEPMLPRWAWSGTGGMMFLGAPSNFPASAMVGERTTPGPVARRSGSSSAVDTNQPMAALGGLGRMAEAVADRSATGTHPTEHLASPLLPMIEGPATGHEARHGVSDVQGAYSQQLLTGFPRQQQGSRGLDAAPTTLWPTSTLQQVERIEKVLSLLPTEWQPSTKVVSAIRKSGVALTPLWQELPRVLNQVRPYETAEEDSAHGESMPQIMSAVASRSPSLSVVSPTTTSAPPASESVRTEATKQQAVEKAMRDAVSAMIQSGGQAGASARLLEAIRTHATAQPSRSDDRVNLGDLTLIALSMGEQRIAASSPDHPKDRLEPNVSSALRMKNHKHVEDDKNSYRKTVGEHAEQVVKHMKDELEKRKLRGQF